MRGFTAYVVMGSLFASFGSGAAFFLSLLSRSSCHLHQRHKSPATPRVMTRRYNTGGWGIGPQRELTPEEFAKGGDRRAFEGYKLRDRGEFMRGVARDKLDLERGEVDELLAVARQAGIKVKDPKERLNKFVLDDDENSDDGDLDLAVRWDENENEEGVVLKKKMDVDSQSITRMDEDTGASGVW